jgi:hypothetical protein
MGLFVGQWIWVGGTAGGANAFATAAYRGWARIKTIAATLLTLELRNWVVGAARQRRGQADRHLLRIVHPRRRLAARGLQDAEPHGRVDAPQARRRQRHRVLVLARRDEQHVHAEHVAR